MTKKNVSSQSFPTTHMRRRTFEVHPRRIASVAKFFLGKVPRPRFDKCVHPQVQMVHGNIRPDVSYLLLARSPHLFHVVEVLLDRSSVGECFQYLDDTGVWICTEQSWPIMVFLHQHHANRASDRAVNCLELLVILGHRFSIQWALDRLPTKPVSRALGQADFVLAILRRAAMTSTLARAQHRRQAAQGNVSSQTPYDDHLRHRQGMLKGRLVYPPSTTHTVSPTFLRIGTIYSISRAAS